MRYLPVSFLFFLLINGSFYAQNNGVFKKVIETDQQEECTIGVAKGSITTDGRPLLWKTRDYLQEPDNVLKYETSFQYKFINVHTAGKPSLVRMGLNEHGFAIVNSFSSDLHLGLSGLSNGELMQSALGNCKTISDFQILLDSTNSVGRRTRANMGVIDSTGVAAIFEIADTIYWRFDAEDEPNGYVIRTNFTVNGGGSGGIERYNRSTELINNFYLGDSLNHKSIIKYHNRDFSDFESDPINIPFADYWNPEIPYGYINSEKSICRHSTVSATVVHGVLPNELAGLSTMWTILGQPASSVTIPFWPVGKTPIETNGVVSSPLCDKSIEIKEHLFDLEFVSHFIDTYKLRNDNRGLWSCTLPLEDFIINEVESYMNDFRLISILPINSMMEIESSIANYTLAELQKCYKSQILDIDTESNRLLAVYPNPFTNKTHLSYTLENESYVKIDVYSYTGQKMETLVNAIQPKGKQIQLFYANEFKYPSGIYFIRIVINARIETYKIVKISN